MIKTEHWIILVSAIFLCFFVPFYYYTAQVETMNDENLVASNNLLSSTHSALVESDRQSELMFADADVRERVVKSFFETYSENYNYNSESARETAKYHIPAIFIVDWNGYYIGYTGEYTGSDGGTYYKEQITDINTWTELYDGYMVNYRLDNEVTVYYNGKSHSGEYSSVYADLGNPSQLSFMGTSDTFKQERATVIITQLNEQVQYYMNTKNTFFNVYNASYQIVLPTSDEATNADVLDMPCVISFTQGSETPTVKSYTDIYAFTASDYVAAKAYYIQLDTDGTLYYHEKDCPELTNTNRRGSMEECAREGAFPHDCVLESGR